MRRTAQLFLAAVLASLGGCVAVALTAGGAVRQSAVAALGRMRINVLESNRAATAAGDRFGERIGITR